MLAQVDAPVTSAGGKGGAAAPAATLAANKPAVGRKAAIAGEKQLEAASVEDMKGRKPMIKPEEVRGSARDKGRRGGGSAVSCLRPAVSPCKPHLYNTGVWRGF